MELRDKILHHFEGKVVRKDLTKLVKGNAIVPTYVLEYLLGQHCATDQQDIIEEGLEKVRSIISKHFVHRDEAQVVKSTIRDKGNHRIIDKVSVELNDTANRYEAEFTNLNLKKIPIDDSIVKKNQKLLSGGVWCIITLGFVPTDERGGTPWIIEGLKPIQISGIDVDEYKAARREFSKDEWTDLLLQSIGLNPSEFTFRSKLLQLTRLVPFTENNYNLIELGPKGTGKSHIYSEMSPHGILLSGGEVTKAKLFVNNANGKIGLVGYWDVVAYDEFAGRQKKTDQGLVDIMKNYMANKSFSRGTDVHGASASMVFVGNTENPVAYMLKHSDLFEALPQSYHDSAFLDRIHAYLPGWEVQKLRSELFTEDYGFIVDYLAEVLKELRKEDRTAEYHKYFTLSGSLTTRDRDAIAKTFSGLLKVIYPHGEYTELEATELFEFAVENRKRVKNQLIKMDETFEEVDFSYVINSSGKSNPMETLEVLNISPRVEDEPEKPSAEKSASPGNIKPSVQQLRLRDNQTGISYERLFGSYFEGATRITLTDPYIRMPYQFRNLMEFVQVILKHKLEGEVVVLHLITSNTEEYQETSRQNLDGIKEYLEDSGIVFSYELVDNIHDRFLILDNGWKITMGRGLDIYTETGGWLDIRQYAQEQRLCKGCEFSFVRESEVMGE